MLRNLLRVYVQQEQPWRRPLTAVLAVLVGLWTAGASVATATAGWIAAETRLELYSRPLAAWAWLVVAGAGTVLAGLPALLLALVPRAQPARVAGRTWALAALLSGVLGAARATVSWPHHELYLALLAVLAGAGWVLLRRFHRGGPAPAHVDCPPGRIFAALAGGLAVLLPWLWAGALGGVVETLAAVLAAAAAGALAAALVTPLWTVYGTGSRWWRIGAGGLVAGTALAALAAGTGRAGTAVALLYVLSPLGFAAATLPRWRALLFGLAAVGPFAFVDPDELTLVLGLREVPFWALLATVCSLVIGLLVGLWWAVGRPGRRFAAVAAVLALAAAATVHIGLGQPGSTGDRLFVVMRATADLSTVDGDRTVRLHETYRRLTGTARASQAPLRRELDRLHLHYTPYYLVNGIEVDAGDWLRPWLAGRTDVARVLLSPRLRPIPAPAPGLRGNRPAAVFTARVSERVPRGFRWDWWSDVRQKRTWKA